MNKDKELKAGEWVNMQSSYEENFIKEAQEVIILKSWIEEQMEIARRERFPTTLHAIKIINPEYYYPREDLHDIRSLNPITVEKYANEAQQHILSAYFPTLNKNVFENNLLLLLL